MNIERELFCLADDGYREFHARLVPTVPKDKIIGVRVPMVRSLAKEFAKDSEAVGFLNDLPHKYYEENNIHAFIIEQTKDIDEALTLTEKFLPYIDNWATCDSFMPKIFGKYPQKVLDKIRVWIKSEHTYTVRYAIGLLMKLFLKENFSCEYPEMISQIRSDEYYINMMIAWYFATALAYRYDDVLPYITEQRLDRWVHNKTIQKAVESNRIDKEVKQYLRGLKI